jgi:Fe-Mn family superoxide dismutase
MKMTHELPKLPYDYNALEPYIDEQTMRIHHTKHHQTYIDKLNAALEQHHDLQKKTAEELIKNLNSIPESIRTAVRNHSGGHANHAFFWPVMKPGGGGEAEGNIADAIRQKFGSFDAFKTQFSSSASGLFGSGWCWLVASSDQVEIITTPNQDSPLSQNKVPLLGIDVWEHAYYLKYQNKRPDYIAAWWNVVNWKKVEDHFRHAKQ